MTNQEAFDKVVKHLEAQGWRKVEGLGGCMYRAPNGCRCAVGALIPDDQYCDSFEEKTVRWIKDDVPALEGLNDMLLSDLQSFHDDWMSDVSIEHNWKRLKELASDFKLEWKHG